MKLQPPHWRDFAQETKNGDSSRKTHPATVKENTANASQLSQGFQAAERTCS